MSKRVGKLACKRATTNDSASSDGGLGLGSYYFAIVLLYSSSRDSKSGNCSRVNVCVLRVISNLS